MSNWSGVTQAYEQSFATLCAGTVGRLLADSRGPRLLDVGCGTGVLAVRAAALGRTVTAVDADPDMVAMTRQRLSAGPGVLARKEPVVHAALPDLPFPDRTFDDVVGNFVVNHVPDPRAAMAELARLVAPGGRLAVTVWPAGGAGWAAVISDVLAAAGAVPLSDQGLAPELDFDRSVEGLAGLAEGAGLAPSRATELGWDWEVTVDALWQGIAGGVSAPGRTYLAQTPQVRAAIAQQYRRQVGRLADARGQLRFPCRAAYVLAEG